MALEDKICFVLMGYGTKMDFATGRALDLDKTYENVIKPVFEELNIRCFRASDVRHSGVIDVPMYQQIQKADIVVADISTLNANAIYELGVRHALRPHTTIVIAEDKLEYPFDLRHINITNYRHLGEDIGVSEAGRIKKELRTLVEAVLAEPKIDSPIYTYLPTLQPPSFTAEEIKELEEVAQEADTVSHLLTTAANALGAAEYEQAKRLLRVALDLAPNDSFIRQQLALATYKAGSPTKAEAFDMAEEILSPLNPEYTHDTETLGLLGAICKRRYILTKNTPEIERAIEYYGRGFILAKDYYNGINLSLSLLELAVTRDAPDDAVADIVYARRVRARTEQYCQALLSDNFEERPDAIWILQTLAEIHYANGDMVEFERLIQQAEQIGQGKFERQSFNEQMLLLEPVLRATNDLMEKWRS